MSEAVLRECIVNLARIKEAVSIAVQKPSEFSPQGLDNVPQLLRGITAGLLMLGKGRAVELMDAIGSEVRRLIEPSAGAPDALRLERIADAIVSIEYYMETLQNGRADPWYMLDNAETCLKALAADDEPRVPDLELAPADAAKTLKLDPEDTLAREERAKRAQAATHPLIAVVAEAEVDPQFLELFIEEAKEEIASIQQSFPLWDQNPMDLEALASLRRSFHTLKGSGRMVGARTIAEFGWAIENLLNRIIDKTLSRTPGMMTLFRSAVAALPQLVDQLESGRQSSVPVDDDHVACLRLCGRPRGRAAGCGPGAGGSRRRCVIRGHRIRGGQGRATAAAAQPGRTPRRASRASRRLRPPASRPRRRWIRSCTRSTARRPPAISPRFASICASARGSRRRMTCPNRSTAPFIRLSGSSKMAEARHGIRITEPLNHFMRKVFDSGRGLSDAGLALLADAVRAIDNVVAHINETTAFFSEQPSLLGRLRKLETDLDAELAAQAASDTSASAIVPALPSDFSGLGAAARARLRPRPRAAAPPSASAPPAPRAAPASPPGESAPAAEEFDHEIANIYSEEATELIEAAETSLTAWNRDRKDKQRVAELQRQLHTLKGGARMAGITAMGDLSHELESLVIQIDGGSVAADDHAHSIMQASLDELARMRDMVSTGTLPSAPTGLLARIRGLASGAQIAVPDAVPASAARAHLRRRRRASRPPPRRPRPCPRPCRHPRPRSPRSACLPRRLRPRPSPRNRYPRYPRTRCRSSKSAAVPCSQAARARPRSAWKWRASTRSCSTPCSTTRAR